MPCQTSSLADSSSGWPLPELWPLSPALILADEPTGNLDSKTGLEVALLLQNSVRKFGQTLIMITHNEELAQLADRILHIEDGRILGKEGDHVPHS